MCRRQFIPDPSLDSFLTLGNCESQDSNWAPTARHKRPSCNAGHGVLGPRHLRLQLCQPNQAETDAESAIIASPPLYD
jgi:hypothetical protein